jgi:hypothetical protein
LQVVAIDAAPDVVTLAGENGAGKSSVLDAIMTALGGVDSKTIPTPIRKGSDRSETVLVLGSGDVPLYTVTRTFTPKGSTVTVANADGAKYGSPQALLSSFTGSLSFDPLAFANMKPAEQVEALRDAMGVDFSALDAEYAAKFAERTGVNRDVDRLRAEANAIQVPANAPDAPVSVSELAAQLSAATRANGDNANARRAAENDARAVTDAERALNDARAAVARLERVLEGTREQAAQSAATASACVDTDTAPIEQRMRDAETLNAAHRAKVQRAEKDKAYTDARAKSDALTKRLDAIRAEKVAKLSAVEFPIKGLEFGDDGIMLDGVPFVQASTAQKLRTSVAVGMRKNPRLRVMLIRDGSLLDKNGMALVREMAKDGGYQFWIEDTRADTDGPGVVEIVDGTVAQ